MRIEGHSVVQFQSFFFLFGGYDIDLGRETNAVLRIDVADAARGLATATLDAPTTLMPDNSGVVSSSSSGMFAYSNNTPTGLASRTIHPGLSEDVVVYAVATTGPSPAPRAFHACCMRGPYMVVWGGSMRGDALMTTTTAGSASGTAADGADQITGGMARDFFASAARHSDGSAAARASTLLDETELFALNLETMAWSRYSVASIAPGIKKQVVVQPRCHATMVCAEESLMLYGGYPTDVHDGEPDVAIAPNEWCVFRIAGNGQCEALEPAGAAPSLWGHAAVYAHRCVLVFGGIDAMTNDDVRSLCVYHVDEGRWRWAEFPEGPCARALHSAVLDPSQSAMLVYGGFSSSPDEAIGNTSAAPLGAMGDEGFDQGRGIGTSGDAGSQLVVQLNDLWSFSLETGLWERLYPSASGRGGGTATTASRSTPAQPSLPRAVHPDGRSGHAAVYHDHRMYVFGGLVDRGQGSSATPPPNWPPGSVSAASNGPRDGGLIIFDLTSRTWRCKNLVMAKGPAPSAAQATSGTAFPGAAVGGVSDGSGAQPAASRESIIDKYLNLQPAAPAAAEVQRAASLTKPTNSGLRTVAARAFSHGATAADSSPLRLAPTSASVMQQHLVTSTMQAVGSSLRRRSADRHEAHGDGGVPPRSTSQPSSSGGGANDAGVPYAIGDSAASRASSESPFATQRALANEFGGSTTSHHDARAIGGKGAPWLQYQAPTSTRGSTLPWQQQSMRGEGGGVSRVVESIAQRQNASDHQWSAAESERRSKLLMQYVQSQDASASLWSTARSGDLQDDEVPSPPASSSSTGLGDARFLVREGTRRQAAAYGDSDDAMRAASLSRERARFSRYSPARASGVVGTASLDVDEAPPVVNVRPHTPLVPGPWLP